MSSQTEHNTPTCAGCGGGSGCCQQAADGKARKPGRIPWLALVLLCMIGAAMLFSQLFTSGKAETLPEPSQKENSLMEDVMKNKPTYTRMSELAMMGQLSDLQYAVTQESATEPAFYNEYHDHFEPGIYVDITSGEPLFLSTDKFESGCGWPAFSKPITEDLISELKDRSFGMIRTEVRSSLSDAHLGHVFDDGPKELGGLRYCINSASLKFVAKADMEAQGYGWLLPLIP